MAVLEETRNTPAAWSSRADLPSSWEAAGWSQQGQSARFLRVLEVLDPRPGETLLDYGCGTGALCELVDPQVAYVGYDWAAGMVVRASREHQAAGRRFQTFDPSVGFDLVAAIGPFNLPDNWQKAYTWQTLRRLWDRCGRALAVSLYAGDDDRCLVYTEAECEAFACSESYRHHVERWRPNDILLVLKRCA